MRDPMNFSTRERAACSDAGHNFSNFVFSSGVRVLLEGAEGIGVSKISLNSLRDEDGFGEGLGDLSRACGWEWI